MSPEQETNDPATSTGPSASREFWEPGRDVRSLGVTPPAAFADSGGEPEEPPSLRGLGRPSVWTAANPPETLFAPQYASAARRAAEILGRPLADG